MTHVHLYMCAHAYTQMCTYKYTHTIKFARARDAAEERMELLRQSSPSPLVRLSCLSYVCLLSLLIPWLAWSVAALAFSLQILVAIPSWSGKKFEQSLQSHELLLIVRATTASHNPRTCSCQSATSTHLNRNF